MHGSDSGLTQNLTLVSQASLMFPAQPQRREAGTVGCRAQWGPLLGSSNWKLKLLQELPVSCPKSLLDPEGPCRGGGGGRGTAVLGAGT